jgi:HEAT repeat protein
LAAFVPHLVSQGDYRLAAEALSELRTVAERPDCLDKTRRRQLEAFTRDLTAAEAVHELITALETGELSSDLDAIKAFITHLGPDLLPRLLRAREKSGSKDLRTMLDSATEQFVREYAASLCDVLRSEDPLVLRAALRLQAGLGRADAIPETIRLLGHDDERVRLGSTEVLVTLGGDAALAALTSQLADPARQVRVAALWGLATWRHEPALPTIIATIDSPSFRTLHSEEQMAILDAYAQIGGSTAIERLGRLLHNRRLLRASEPTGVRACAARALGVTVHHDAKALLERARKDRDPEVRRTALRSLRKQGS